MSEMWQSSKGGVIERGHVLNDPYQLKVPLNTPLHSVTTPLPRRYHPVTTPCTPSHPVHPRTPPHHALHPTQSWAIEDMPTPADFAAAASDNAASLSGKRSPDTASTNRLAGLANSNSSPGRGSSSSSTSPRSPSLRGGGSAAAAGTKADELFEITGNTVPPWLHTQYKLCA